MYLERGKSLKPNTLNMKVVSGLLVQSKGCAPRSDTSITN